MGKELDEQRITLIRSSLKGVEDQWDEGGVYILLRLGCKSPMAAGIDEVEGPMPSFHDAHLVANAPRWLRFLLAKLDAALLDGGRLKERLEAIKTERERCAFLASERSGDSEAYWMDVFNEEAK